MEQGHTGSAIVCTRWKKKLQGQLICECELVTRAMLENAARQNPTLTLDDLRRDVRSGHGAVPGRLLHLPGRRHPARDGATAGGQGDADGAERTAAGTSPICSRPSTARMRRCAIKAACRHRSPTCCCVTSCRNAGRASRRSCGVGNCKQERLDELIYLSMMNADHLPDDGQQSPVTEFYHFDTTPNDKTEAPA